VEPGAQPCVYLRLIFVWVTPHEILTHHGDTKSLKVECSLQFPSEALSCSVGLVHDSNCTAFRGAAEAVCFSFLVHRVRWPVGRILRVPRRGGFSDTDLLDSPLQPARPDW